MAKQRVEFLVKIANLGNGVFGAIYKCPDPECDGEHLIATIDDSHLPLPGVRAKFEAFVKDVLVALADNFAKNLGAEVDHKSVSMTNVRDMN